MRFDHRIDTVFYAFWGSMGGALVKQEGGSGWKPLKPLTGTTLDNA